VAASMRRRDPTTPSRDVRCGGCRSKTRRATLGGRDLGFDGYCPKCARRLTTDCLRRYRRLPDLTVGEFLCPRCDVFRPAKLRTLPDKGRDGQLRQRWRCRLYRRATYKRAHANQRARRR
jgi:hypothetical protein